MAVCLELWSILFLATPIHIETASWVKSGGEQNRKPNTLFGVSGFIIVFFGEYGDVW